MATAIAQSVGAGLSKFEAVPAPGRSSPRPCPTGKYRFRDRVGALVALAESMRRASGNRNEVRAYRCELCRGWHLTSKALYERPRLEEKAATRRQPYQRPSLEQERASKPRNGPGPPGGRAGKEQAGKEQAGKDRP